MVPACYVHSERLVMCTVATTVPPLCQNFISGHLWTIWHLRWSGGDEVGATGGHVDQQLEDDDGHLPGLCRFSMLG